MRSPRRFRVDFSGGWGVPNWSICPSLKDEYMEKISPANRGVIFCTRDSARGLSSALWRSESPLRTSRLPSRPDSPSPLGDAKDVMMRGGTRTPRPGSVKGECVRGDCERGEAGERGERGRLGGDSRWFEDGATGELGLIGLTKCTWSREAMLASAELTRDRGLTTKRFNNLMADGGHTHIHTPGTEVRAV